VFECVRLSTRGTQHEEKAMGNGEMCLRDSNMCCVTFLFMTCEGCTVQNFKKSISFQKILYILL